MIKLIYQSILHKKSKFFLLMIQFTIGFAALLFGLNILFNLLQYKESLEELAPLDTVHAYIIESESDALLEKDITIVNKYSEVFNQLKENNLVDRLGLFEKIYVSNSPQESNDTFLYMLNKDSLELSNLTLEQGTMEPLKSEVQQFETIPVIVSSAMKNQYKLGETYPLYYIDRNDQYVEISIKVVGISAPSVHYWGGGSTYVSESMLDNKEFILSAQFKEFEDYSTFIYNSLVQLPKHESKTEREVKLEQIQLLFEQNELDLQFTTLQEELDSYYESEKVMIIGTITFAAILLILSLLGCIGAILASITTRYREFGIYYSLGFTRKHINRLVFGEIIAIFGVSFVISIIGSNLLLPILLADEFTINFTLISITFIIMIISIVLTTILPLLKLKQIEPIEMLKGMNR